MQEVQLRAAKAGLSRLVDQAQDGTPSIITRHGKAAAVVVSYAEWQRLSSVPSFARMLMACPLEEGDLPPRSTDTLREVDLG